MIELTKFESEEMAKSKKQSTKVHKSAEVIENRWDPLGEDAAYIYRYLKKHNNVIDYKTFIKGHQSWLSNYKARNLAKISTTARRDSKNSTTDNVSYSIFIML